MMKKILILMSVFILIAGFLNLSAWADTTLKENEKVDQENNERKKSFQETLPFDAFLELAAQKDTVFEEILIDELTLQYQKDLKLPARDLVASVKTGYEVFLDQNREKPHLDATLSKLFPKLGTEAEISYTVNPTFTSQNASPATFSFSIAQPIAENAFGRSTRLLDKIVGMEIDIARHQIVEAYEDYLAFLISAYYDWYGAYENLKIAESSYQENVKLLDNMRERQKSNIALPIDVNKIELQVIGKRETLITLTERYENALNFIRRAIRDETMVSITPVRPGLYDEMLVSFDEDFLAFQNSGRTYEVLRLLEEKSDLVLGRDFDDLFPSVNLLFEYDSSGKKMRLENSEDELFVGAQIDLPIPDQVERAEYGLSKIAKDRTLLSVNNTHYELFTNLKNLYESIQRETKLLAVADEKLVLAKSVLEDETENYTLGKVDLNDYIQAVNAYDNNRFNKVTREVNHKKLLVEWLRLTDRLITDRQIRERHEAK